MSRAPKHDPEMHAKEKIAVILAVGAVCLVMTIAVGSFGRAFYLAHLLREDHQISDAATQLLTALGSSLVGGVIGYLSGLSRKCGGHCSK